ncbi:caspase domain-containing protein [Phellopilus nigrolimitatus]|nr:caspase domain-containing protein [Phellopilus nigrolimitatus]
MGGISIEIPKGPQKSASSGAKKALLIGIQYKDAVQYSHGDPPPELGVSHNDTEVLKKILTHFYDYKEEDIVVLKDDGKHTLPTRENILSAIDDLIRDAKAGDHFVFHYSGHGSQIPNRGDDYEEDDMDEVIWPVDVVYRKDLDEEVESNFIIDDELKIRLVDSLPAGTHLTVILDCCHSGTGVASFEFEELWSPAKSPVSPAAGNFFPDGVPLAAVNARGSLKLNLQGNVLKRMRTLEDGLIERAERIAGAHTVQENDDDKYVTSWAACIDKDVEVEGEVNGMLTQAFWEILSNNRSLTNEELIRALAKQLIITTRPAKKYFRENNWGEISCPKPVLGSLQKFDAIHEISFTF